VAGSHTEEARDAIKLDLYIMIACGFGLSQALVNSGAAELVANGTPSCVPVREKPGVQAPLTQWGRHQAL
jgi:di/tricarboxylate transporter